MNKEKWLKVLKGAGLAAGAAVLAYLIDAIPGFSIPQEWQPAIVAVLSVLLNIIRKIVI